MDMSDKLSVDGQKKNKDSQFADVDFEVLMEFQRQVMKKFGSGRVPWFLSAIGDLAELKGVTPNNAMKSALENFDRFIKDVKKNSGSIPPENDHVNNSETDLLDDIDDVDRNAK
jgi:hypothetical protein